MFGISSHRSTRMIFSLLLGTATASIAVLPATGQEQAESTPKKADNQLELHLKSVDYIFAKVRDSNWDKDFDVEEWTAKKDEIRQKITADTSVDEVRGLMSGLLVWLERSHYSIMPADLYDGWGEDEAKGKDGHAGMSFRVIDGKALVSEVWKGSDAEKRGVQAGWELTSLKEKSVEEFITALRDSLPERMKNQLGTLVAVSLDGQVVGSVGTEILMDFKDAHGESKSLSIKLVKKEGEVVKVFHLPEMIVRHEAKELPGGVGYLMFEKFLAPQKIFADLKKAIEIAEKGKGLVIDLRGNLGGLGFMAMGIGGPLMSDESEKDPYLGTLITRDSSLKFVLTPRLNPYNGPVAILTDECSASASEILVGGLQSLKRARVFGKRTAGLALPAMTDILPNGDRFMYAIATYVDAMDRTLEGDGVTPDEEITVTRESLLEGKDVVLEAAVLWIEKEASS